MLMLHLIHVMASWDSHVDDVKPLKSSKLSLFASNPLFGHLLTRPISKHTPAINSFSPFLTMRFFWCKVKFISVRIVRMCVCLLWHNVLTANTAKIAKNFGVFEKKLSFDVRGSQRGLLQNTLVSMGLLSYLSCVCARMCLGCRNI